ncbi:hypothetical protein FB45DRAFT_941167 [Roridomyces roridus]|uniref:Thioesterase domain-containing protein n=1 Tax=Roridomyces roridus TaxID=1738132 RepID=A0AAD7FAB0_9AGAR|nr:hypothetical protein FB45DRAFT_941167 [Roridomyces roridus]
MAFDLDGQVAILSAPIPNAILSSIAGNASSQVKGTAVRWINAYRAPQNCFTTLASTQHTVREVSVHPEPVGNGQVLTLVCELDVVQEMLDGRNQLSNTFLVALIDEYASASVSALDLADGGMGSSGVSLGLNTVFHNPVQLGSKLRFINTTLARTSGAMSCRTEVWDLTKRKLAATAVFTGMLASFPAKSRPKL